jgi:hypothetical protein
MYGAVDGEDKHPGAEASCGDSRFLADDACQRQENTAERCDKRQVGESSYSVRTVYRCAKSSTVPLQRSGPTKAAWSLATGCPATDHRIPRPLRPRGRTVQCTCTAPARDHSRYRTRGRIPAECRASSDCARRARRRSTVGTSATPAGHRRRCPRFSLHDAYQFALRLSQLKMQAAQRVSHGRGVVVLKECCRKARVGELGRVEGLEKKPPGIAVDIGFDEDHPRQVGVLAAHAGDVRQDARHFPAFVCVDSTGIEKTAVSVNCAAATGSPLAGQEKYLAG